MAIHWPDNTRNWAPEVRKVVRELERLYAEAEELMKEIGARPHLGKFCESFNQADMGRLHGNNLTRFLELVVEHDPDGKFANSFTRRLLGHEA